MWRRRRAARLRRWMRATRRLIRQRATRCPPLPPRARDGTGQDRTGLGITRGGTVYGRRARAGCTSARVLVWTTRVRARGRGQGKREMIKRAASENASWPCLGLPVCVALSRRITAVSGGGAVCVDAMLLRRGSVGTLRAVAQEMWTWKENASRRKRGGLPAVTPRQGRRKRAV